MTKTHDLNTTGSVRGNTHGNKASWPHRPDSERWPELSLRKVPADSVPYGESISRNGRTVWAAYHNGNAVAVAVTRDECRTKYRDWHIAMERQRVKVKNLED